MWWAIHSIFFRWKKWFGCQPEKRLPEEFGGLWKNLLPLQCPGTVLCWFGCFYLFSRSITTWCHLMTEAGENMSLTSPTLTSLINVLWPLDPEVTTGKAQLVKMVRTVLGQVAEAATDPAECSWWTGPGLSYSVLWADHNSLSLSDLLGKTSHSEWGHSLSYGMVRS